MPAFMCVKTEEEHNARSFLCQEVEQGEAMSSSIQTAARKEWLRNNEQESAATVSSVTCIQYTLGKWKVAGMPIRGL